MPSSTPKQQRFFQAVRAAKSDPNAPAHLKKVANSMTDSDINDFANSIAELKIKKAVLAILKDIREPMYLNEDGDEGQTNPIAKTFKVEDDFATYIKKYVGQPLSPKEFEAIETFKRGGGREATKIERTEIWYESTDQFNNSITTVVKKMKDGTQFSFNAFSKYSPVEPEKPAEPEMGTTEPDLGTEPPPMGGPEAGMPPGPEGAAPPGAPTPPAEPAEPPKPEKKKDEIVVTKSILFKDDIKGGSILAEFLKKLDI